MLLPIQIGISPSPRLFPAAREVHDQTTHGWQSVSGWASSLWCWGDEVAMGEPIRDIVIVGGGTTGWLAGALLNHRLQWGLAHPDGVRITLIESPDTPTIGVGEATIPPIRHTLQMLDIDEGEFIARTQATFKLGVRLDDWDRDAQG